MSELFPEEDRCTDPIDQACQTEQRMRANDLALARARSKPEQFQVPLTIDGSPVCDDAGNTMMFWTITECVDCGEDILPARLALGKVRCVNCQGIKEKREKGYGS